MQVLVRDNNVDQALKALKKDAARAFSRDEARGHYEKPSEKKAREKAEACAAPASWRARSCSAKRPAADEAEALRRRSGADRGAEAAAGGAGARGPRR